MLSICTTLLFTPKPGENLNNDIFASAVKQTPFSFHCMFYCSLPISGKVPGLGNTFVFILLNVVLYSELSR